MRTSCLFGLLVVLVSFSTPALAGDASIFVNEVNVDGLTNQSFEKVNVRIDEKGNVHIEAPGYSVKRVETRETRLPQPEGVITRKYFLVTEQNVQGMTEYDVDVFLNGKFLRTLSSSEPQIVSELTKQLRPGRNHVVLQAKKKLANKDQPKSVAPAHVFRVIIGEGAAGAEQVIIEKQVVTFSRNAAEMNDIAQEFTFTTR